MGNQIQQPNLMHEFDKADPMRIIKTHPEINKNYQNTPQTTPREKSSTSTSTSSPQTTPRQKSDSQVKYAQKEQDYDFLVL